MKKILLTLGATTTALTPIVAVVACGKTDESSPDTGHKNNHSKDRNHSNNHKYQDIDFLEVAEELLLKNISGDHNKIEKLPSKVPTLTSDNLLSEMFPSIKDDDDLKKLKGITFSKITKSKVKDKEGSLTLSFTMNYNGQQLSFEKQEFHFYTTSENQYAEDLAAIKAINYTSVWTTKFKTITAVELTENFDIDTMNENNYATMLSIPKIEDWGEGSGNEYDDMTAIGFERPGVHELFIRGGEQIPPKGWDKNKNRTDTENFITLGKQESAISFFLKVRKGRAEFKITFFVRGFTYH